MPQYYGEAARLLFTLTRLGLTISSGIDAREIVNRIAILIQLYHTNMPSLSHAGAARWILDDISRNGDIRLDGNTNRLIAVIGTFLGNIQSASRAHKVR